MGYGELIRALAGEAAREAQAVRQRGAAEAAAILAEARRAAEAAHQALTAREAEEAGVRRRAALAAAAQERERTLLLERRRLLGGLRDEAARQLEAAGGDDALLARLVGEVLAAAPAGPFTLVVDPGVADRARAALAAGHPEALARATLEEAPARRGGVELRAGPLVLDDTLTSRLARAWPLMEPALARRLFGEG